MIYRTFREARNAVLTGETGCEKLVSSFFDRIDEANTELNIFISVDREGALVRAKELDSRLQKGEDLPLAGMMMGVKDVICIKGRSVTCGSRILEGFESLYDASAISRLRDAGAIFLGKTNCDEFAMGSSNENSYYGPVRNPRHPEYVPGGSSGGSAAAVAAGMCHVALGSDTGGSVRQPAAFCGVVGLKPTYGRVSRYGLVAYASSFDSIGVLASDVFDAAAVLKTIAGHDPNDATSASEDVDDYREKMDRSIDGLRIGLPVEYFAEGLDPEIGDLLKKQVARFEEAGAVTREVSLPHTKYGVATYYILATAEASSNLARYDGVRYGYRADVNELRRQRQKEPAGNQTSLLEELYVRSRTEGFGDEVKRRIMLGTYVLSSGYYDAFYGKAQRVRTLIRQDFDRAFEDVDVLLTPATPTPPFKIGSQIDDPLAMYLGDVYTVTANLAGIPGLVVPLANHSSGLPVGMQLLSRHFDESTLLRVGNAAMSS